MAKIQERSVYGCYTRRLFTAGVFGGRPKPT